MPCRARENVLKLDYSRTTVVHVAPQTLLTDIYRLFRFEIGSFEFGRIGIAGIASTATFGNGKNQSEVRSNAGRANRHKFRVVVVDNWIIGSRSILTGRDSVVPWIRYCDQRHRCWWLRRNGRRWRWLRLHFARIEWGVAFGTHFAQYCRLLKPFGLSQIDENHGQSVGWHKSVAGTFISFRWRKCQLPQWQHRSNFEGRSVSSPDSFFGND